MNCLKPFVFILLLSTTFVFAQNTHCPFNKGFNLAQWFEKESASEIRNSYTKTDLENLIALGADHVRLPIHLYNMSGNAPEYLLDPILFLNLDRVVDWAEELGLHLILDNHITDAVDTTGTDRLVAVWQQMAEHFKNRSTLIYYEIRNEPFGINDADWGEMQRRAIEAIRAIDTVHTLIVSPAGMGSWNNLAQLPNYADDNLIYTFHFYDPFLFTHQGADWTNPSMADFIGIPYPYDASRMPAIPASFQGTWLGDLYGWYENDGTKTTNQSKADVATQFRSDRQVPIYCGEFGALQAGSTQEDRLQWTEDIANIFRTGDVSWSMWGYGGSFGIFKEGSSGGFPEDLDSPIVEALGLTVPQAPAEIFPITTDVVFFDDLSYPDAFDIGWGSNPDYYIEGATEGAYCIQWTGADRYQAFGWRFAKSLDLSTLMENEYILKFWLKSTSSDLRIDVRFLDTDLGDGDDHPWRMSKTIDGNLVSMDGGWHEVEIPLQDMVDSGSWHNNNWYNSEGKFDWTRIDLFQFVAEHHALQTMEVHIDHVRIVQGAVNTAVEPVLSVSPKSLFLHQAFPNPFNPSTTIRFELAESGDVDVRIYNVTGSLVRVLQSGQLTAGYHNLSWDATDESGTLLPSGMYVYVLKTGEQVLRKKMLLIK